MKTDLSHDLASLAGLSDKVGRADERLRAAAAHRRDEIDTKLAELRTRAMTDARAAKEYQSLILERGRLGVILSA